MNYSAIKKAVNITAEQAIEEIIASGLRDRDYDNRNTGKRLKEHGLTHDTGRRLPLFSENDVVKEGESSPKHLICHCVDQEPGVRINEFLVNTQASEILDGALVAAYTTSSTNIFVHVAQDKNNERTMNEAVKEALEVINQLNLKVNIEIVKGAPEKPLIGFYRYPTMILNGETAMQIASVINSGKEWYQQIGHSKSPGTKLFDVRGSVKKPGIYEVPTNTTLRRVIDELGGGMEEGKDMMGVILGGIQGGFLTEEELDITLDFDSAREAGALIGMGSIQVLDQSQCIVHIAKESTISSMKLHCGRCSVGREGSYQLKEMLTDMTIGKSRPQDIDMIKEISHAMRKNSLCSIGKTAPNLILSTIKNALGEYEAHMKRKVCKNLVCSKYLPHPYQAL
jgi:NADH-quinone oxidoreductase subunit F